MEEIDIVFANFLNPKTVEGAIFFGILFLLGSTLVARALRVTINTLVRRDTNKILDRTAVNFFIQSWSAPYFCYSPGPVRPHCARSSLIWNSAIGRGEHCFNHCGAGCSKHNG